MMRAADDSPWEESRGRMGIGMDCILGLVGMFLLRLETRSFCSSGFSLEEAYWDLRLLVVEETEPSLLPSYFISTNLPFLFFNYYFNRIYVFLAPSASSLMRIHSWQKGNLLNFCFISLFFIDNLLHSLETFLRSVSILRSQLAFLFPAFMSSLYYFSNLSCSFISPANSPSLYTDFSLLLLKLSMTLFLSVCMLRLVQSLRTSTEKASSLMLSLQEMQSLMVLRDRYYLCLQISQQQFWSSRLFYDSEGDTFQLRFCRARTLCVFSNQLMDCYRNSRQFNFCLRSSSQGRVATDCAMDWLREMDPRSTV